MWIAGPPGVLLSKKKGKNSNSDSVPESVHGTALRDLAQVTFVDTTDLSTAESLERRWIECSEWSDGQVRHFSCFSPLIFWGCQSHHAKDENHSHCLELNIKNSATLHAKSMTPKTSFMSVQGLTLPANMLWQRKDFCYINDEEGISYRFILDLHGHFASYIILRLGYIMILYIWNMIFQHLKFDI